VVTRADGTATALLSTGFVDTGKGLEQLAGTHTSGGQILQSLDLSNMRAHYGLGGKAATDITLHVAVRDSMSCVLFQVQFKAYSSDTSGSTPATVVEESQRLEVCGVCSAFAATATPTPPHTSVPSPSHSHSPSPSPSTSHSPSPSSSSSSSSAGQPQVSPSPATATPSKGGEGTGVGSAPCPAVDLRPAGPDPDCGGKGCASPTMGLWGLFMWVLVGVCCSLSVGTWCYTRRYGALSLSNNRRLDGHKMIRLEEIEFGEEMDEDYDDDDDGSDARLRAKSYHDETDDSDGLAFDIGSSRRETGEDTL